MIRGEKESVDRLVEIDIFRAETFLSDDRYVLLHLAHAIARPLGVWPTIKHPVGDALIHRCVKHANRSLFEQLREDRASRQRVHASARLYRETCN